MLLLLRVRVVLLGALALSACSSRTMSSHDGADPAGGASGSAGVAGSSGQQNAGTGGTTTGASNGGSSGQIGGAGSGSAPSTGGASGTASGGTSGNEAGAAGAGDEDPRPTNAAAPCDDSAPELAFMAVWTVPAGRCLHWTGPARVPPPGLHNDPNDGDGPCDPYAHDPGTGKALGGAPDSCGVLSVFVGEPARQVRLPAGVEAEYGNVDPVTGSCTGPWGENACGESGTAREQCEPQASGAGGTGGMGCFASVCCYIAVRRTTACDSVPLCDGSGLYPDAG